MTQIQQFSLFGNQGGGLVWQAVQTANLNATANYGYPINTSSGPVYVTLPASPTIGQQIAITDYAGTFAGNNCIINPNGGKISGSSANAVLATSREGASIVYVDSTQGWLGFGNFVNNPIGPYTITYLIVAGGGSGGSSRGGGGGGGGVLTGTTLITSTTVYTIQVGAGGAANTNGANSSAFGLTAIGGGTGGGEAGYAPSLNGSSGGSGGGGATPGTGGSGTSGQGFAGGTAPNLTTNYLAAGGGGASAVGADATNTTGGNGGAGIASSITGSSVTYAGGGGGSGNSGTPGSGGSGGGGAGTVTAGATGGAGTVNTGGGGGGGAGTATRGTGGAGGAGVVILSIPTGNYTGIKTGSPLVSTSGNFTILTFTVSGSYTA
jgi:hypothetical protein